jgi:hypothetical protein
MSNLTESFNKKLAIDTQLSDESPPLGVATLSSNGDEDERDEGAVGFSTPKQKKSASWFQSAKSPVPFLSNQTVKEYFEEVAEHAGEDDVCVCSPPKNRNNQYVEETVGTMTRRIMRDGHLGFPFYDARMKRMFLYLYAKEVNLAARTTPGAADLFQRILLGEKSAECNRVAALMCARGDEFIPESEIKGQWQTFETFKAQHPLNPNFDISDEYFDIFQEGRHRPFRRNQIFGTCYIHGVVTLLFYLVQRTDQSSTWVIDISRYICNALEAYELLDHILDKGRDGLKFLKKILALSDGDLTCIDPDMNCGYRKGTVIDNLKKHGPFLVTGFCTTRVFKEKPWAIHNVDSFDEKDLTGEKHAMVVVGAWEPKDSKETWLLLQNWYKNKQFTWMEAKYIKSCGGVMHLVTKSICKGDVQACDCWHECGSTRVVAECSSPLILTSDVPEDNFEKNSDSS